MSVLVVNRFGEFISGLTLESKVLSFSDDGTNTTLSVENVFHIRALPAPYTRSVKIDNIDRDVIAVDYVNNNVTVVGVLLSASVYLVPNPFYWFGTLISTGNEINLLDATQKCPMVYLNEIVLEELQPKSSNLETIANLRIAFADFYSNDWTRQDHYDQAIFALCNLAAFVKKELQKGKCVHIGQDDSIRQRNVPKWGKIERVGTNPKVFNEYLDAVEWEFPLRISKCCK